MTFPTVTLSAGALKNNLAVVRSLAPASRVVAAVKANAYGHGLVPAARALADADAFGVARLDEAIVLRDAGITHPILLLEGVLGGEELKAAAQLRCEIVVHSFEQIATLEVSGARRAFKVWLKVDSGMSRLGFRLEEFQAALERLRRCEAVESIRLMSHLASADAPDDAVTKQQIDRFESLAASLGLERSIANSAGIIAWPRTRLDWVRPGIMLYGISPFAGRSAASLGLEPVMTLRTRVIAVRDIPAGERIGYGGIWSARRPSRIAVIAIGYGDGYPRCMRAGAPVLINGREAPVAGRVSMDMTMVDVTELQDVRVGDPVTLWGEGLPVERVAPFADTIAYELVCRVAPRVKPQWT
ncbi:MAG TPA: alanine racemase [Steroidobacter sp.]